MLWFLLQAGHVLADVVADSGAPSVDVALARPSFYAEDATGLRSPWGQAPGTRQLGAIWGFEQDPVVVWADGAVSGRPVAARQSLTLGLAWSPLSRLAIAADVPVLVQRGDGQTGLDADGFGLGDLRGGLRLTGLDRPHAGLAAQADLFLPTGTQGAWMGEAAPRLELGLAGGLRAGPVQGLASASYLLRPSIDTGYSPIVDDTIQASAGLRLGPAAGRLAVDVAWRGRRAASVDPDRVELNASELGLGLRYASRGSVGLTLGVSHGLAPGLGGTSLSTVAGLSLRGRSHPRPVAPVAPPLSDDDDELWLPERADPPALAARPSPAASAITAPPAVLDPIPFALGSDQIALASQPALDGIASLLAALPEAEALVIEGHASDDGGYSYNYDLALRRGLAVYRALVDAGVDPQRLSLRSLGEVAPAGVDPDAERRVDLLFVHRLDAVAPPRPTLRPWDGAHLPAPAGSFVSSTEEEP